MAQKKKKGKPPQQKNQNQPKRRKIGLSQVIFSMIAVIMILSLILPLLIR
jgi:hypothetical protein